jgi:bifunctional polynucleotide phosphatase/kinase
VKHEDTPESFRWIKPPEAKPSCLYGINLNPKCESKIAAFDLDGTLIKSNIKKGSDPIWEWWRNVVPVKLKQVHEEG